MPRDSATEICTWSTLRGVPQRLEQRVGEAGHEEVLHGLLAEVVVDPEDLVLLEDPADRVVDSRAEARSWPIGFSITTRDVGVDDADLGEPRADRAEQARREGEVEDADGLVVPGSVLGRPCSACQSSGAATSSETWCSRASSRCDGGRVEVRGATCVASASATMSR